MGIDATSLKHLFLKDKVFEAREKAYAPYSGFKVGAVLIDRDGAEYTGCNIENAAYSPGICAERTAFAKAVSEGAREFEAILIGGWPDGGEEGFAYPCGVCRQVMMEFCDPKTFKVIVVNGDGHRTHTLEELIPHGFGPADLA